jgi:hypothetical protein
MKNLGPVIAATLWATSAATAMAGTNGGEAVNGISRGGVELLVVGPVEAIDQAAKTAVVLGQRVLVADANHLALGETAAVFGTARADGSIVAAAIQSRGPYVPGASAVFISGVVQKSEPSVGQVTIGGLSIDLTPSMSRGIVSPAEGTRFEVSGTQPVSRGIVISGISGGGAAVSGISGGGGALGGISGGGIHANGISGGGAAVSGISGGGIHANGISGGGAAVSGISGGGIHANGISGGGAAVSGISGGGAALN